MIMKASSVGGGRFFIFPFLHIELFIMTSKLSSNFFVVKSEGLESVGTYMKKQIQLKFSVKYLADARDLFFEFLLKIDFDVVWGDICHKTHIASI